MHYKITETRVHHWTSVHCRIQTGQRCTAGFKRTRV